MSERAISPTNKEYYTSQQPIGLFVLLNTLKEQQLVQPLSPLEKTILFTLGDWNYLFMTVDRLQLSLEKKDRWEVALDGTCFYLFLRIYFDSLASLIHQLFKLKYPSESHNWLTAMSFSEQLKWLAKTINPVFDKYKEYMKTYSFDKFFQDAKNFRDRLKAAPQVSGSKRLLWQSKDDYPDSGTLKGEASSMLHKIVMFTDFLGDYFLVELELPRLEHDHNGFPRGFMSEQHIDIYKRLTS